MKKIIKIIAIMLSILFCFSNLYCYAISNTDDKNVYDNAKATEEFEEKEDISNGTESKEIQEVCDKNDDDALDEENYEFNEVSDELDEKMQDEVQKEKIIENNNENTVKQEESNEKKESDIAKNQEENKKIQIDNNSDVDSSIDIKSVKSVQSSPVITKSIERIEDGEYEIRTVVNSNRVFDIGGGSVLNGARLQIWDDANVLQQRFYIKHIGDNYYCITVRKSDKVLDVQGGSSFPATPVQQFSSNGTEAQQWRIYRTSDGYYSIESRCNGLFMECVDDNAACGTQIIVNPENNRITQKFKLDKVLKDKGIKTVEDGEYEIRCSLNENEIFDIGGGSVLDGAKLQLWHDAEVTQQRYIVKYMNNGYYKITVSKSQKVLEVQDSSISNNTPVQQSDYKGTDAQQWIIKDAGDGYYSIVSKCNGLYMDVSNENSLCGSPIIVSDLNNKQSQRFIFDKVLKEKGTRSLEDGEYEIKSVLNENKVFDIGGGSTADGAKVQLWNDVDVPQQRFLLKYIDDGFYSITAKNSNRVLDVPGASIKDGVGIQQFSSNGTDAQRWIIKELDDGNYCVISKCNGLYIDIKDGVASNGAEIVLSKQSNNCSQRFNFSKIEKIKGTKTISDGVYEIKTSANNRVFDIDCGMCNNGAKVQLWDDADVAQQRFRVEYLNDGCYSIINVNSKKSLDVPGGSISKGIALHQFEWNGTDAQRWIIKDLGDGNYNIIAKCNELYVSIADSRADNGTMIIMDSKNEQNQKFEFIKVSEIKGIDVSSYQGKIDWNKVKNSGIEFAMIRVGYRGYESGALRYDSSYTYNIENALKNDIKCGVYFYSQAINEYEAREEADYVISAIKKYNITYPVVYDSEYSSSSRNGRADYLTKNQRTDICKAFCDRVIQYGYTPMIYASKYWFYDDLDLQKLGNYKKWVAHYVNGAPDKRTDYKYEYSMWQYTDKGLVNGIDGPVDMDIQY